MPVIRTVGVEEEFLLVSASSPNLIGAGDDVVAAAEDGSVGQFEHELKRQQAELGTSPREDMSRLSEDLLARRAELASAAARRGVRLIASGTSPGDQRSTTTPDPRYRRMTEVFGRVARNQLTCGMHVHVSIDSDDEGVAVLDRLRPWLPVVLALSANSPFLDGEDTGYASYRSVLWGQWPTAGSGEPFGDVATYERCRADLVASGAALDDGMIYFDARLSARYPTVEIRVADVCPDAADAVTIAALTRALVSTCAEQARKGQEVPSIPSRILRAASWRASRYGLDDDLFDTAVAQTTPAWTLISAMVREVAPALAETGDTELVHEGLAAIRHRGTGATLQRRAHRRRGDMGDVIDALATHTN